MGWFGEDHKVTQGCEEFQSTSQEHKAKFSHEAIAAAAAFEAAKAYEEHCAKDGKPDSHAKAKEIVAGLTGAFIDREVETRGLDYIDKERAKKQAEEHVQEEVAKEYNGY